jgi:hypothetical protein
LQAEEDKVSVGENKYLRDRDFGLQWTVIDEVHLAKVSPQHAASCKKSKYYLLQRRRIITQRSIIMKMLQVHNGRFTAYESSSVLTIAVQKSAKHKKKRTTYPTRTTNGEFFTTTRMILPLGVDSYAR